MYELPCFFAIDHDTLPTALKLTKLSHRHWSSHIIFLSDSVKKVAAVMKL